MKQAVKIGSLLLAILMVFTAVFASGCSLQKQWSYKTSDKELAIGVYIYNLDVAYQQALEYAKKLDDYDGTNDKWLDLEITDDDGTTAVARQWMKDKAEELTLTALAVEKGLKDEGATVDSATLQAADEQAKTNWNVGPYANYGYVMPMSKELEPHGVSFDSYKYAAFEGPAMQQVLFNTLYEKGGSQEVSDAELEKFFSENYVDYAYLSANLYESSTDEAGTTNNVALSEDAVKQITDKFDGMVKDINSGKAFDDVSKAYTEAEGLSSDSVVNNTELLKNFSAGDELKVEIEKLDSGKAATVKVGEGDSAMIYLVYKKDINAIAKDYLESASNRSEVLTNMKTDDFKTYIKDLIKELKYEKNAAVDSYDPKMFFVAEKPTTTAESSESEGSDSSKAEG